MSNKYILAHDTGTDALRHLLASVKALKLLRGVLEAPAFPS